MVDNFGELTGKQLGNYRLIRLLGQGGFADVYLGEHIHLTTNAAIKVLRIRLSDENVNAFKAEAQTIARLEHPHIVRVLDFGVENGTPFLVMSYAPNGTLRRFHPRGTVLPLATVVPYVKQVAGALQYAHNQNLIHRDVKPENMLLSRNNDVLLSDFGLAVVKQSSRYSGAQDVSGTAVYMAPEQLQGRPGPASDQYALAVVVYEWLTGTPPFDGSFAELCAQHLTTMPTSIRTKNPTITPDVEHVLFMALAKDPRQRFGSVEAFARALGQANEPTYRISEGPQPVSVLQPPPPPGVQPPPSGGNLVPPPPPGMQPYQSPGMNMNVYNGQPGAMYQSGGPAAQPPVQSGFYPPPGVSGAFPPVAPNQPPFAGASQYGMQPGNNGPAQGSTPVVPQEAGLPKHDDPTVTSQRQKNAAAETEEVRAPAQPQAPATSEKKKSGKGKALAIVGTIVALLLVLAVLAPTVLLPLLQGKQAKGNSTSAANAATSTPAPTDTPTATDTVTPTDTVTATTTDTPTPIVTPPPVSTGPYTADWSKGLGDWTGSPQWKAVGDGSIGSSGDDANNPNLFAPYQAAKANYSVESKMQFVRSTQYSYDYGIVVRTTDSNDGYAAGVYNSGAYIAKMAAGKVDYYNLLQQKDLQPDTLTHVIRVDVKNNSISLYIDNVLEVQTTDNSYLDPGRVGLRAASTDVNVFSFKVTPLS